MKDLPEIIKGNSIYGSPAVGYIECYKVEYSWNVRDLSMFDRIFYYSKLKVTLAEVESKVREDFPDWKIIKVSEFVPKI